MFRVLLVEDFAPTLNELKELLLLKISGIKVDLADTVEEGEKLIRSLYKQGEFYSAGILDFKLPLKKGENDEVDESLCCLIRQLMPLTFVIHITGYPEDPDILKHMKDCHSDHWDPHGKIVSKRKSGWSDSLVETLKIYLPRAHIKIQMDQLFGLKGRAAGLGQSRGGGFTGIDLTQAIGDINRDIITYWDNLDEKLQRDIKQRFNVEPETNPITVTLK